MQMLSEFEILTYISQQTPFEAEIEGGAFKIKIEGYQPAICTAIHAGHRLRPDLTDKCALTEQQRLYEEDPYTNTMIASLPITLTGQDSRYEYDLNRALSSCIYTHAWGKQVWAAPLSKAQRELSRQKHRQFYRVLRALISQLEKMFGGCVLFDIHSYNHQRIKRETPVFNIGSKQINMERWGETVKLYLKTLGDTKLTHSRVTTAQNDVFYGLGYLTRQVNRFHTNCLVLPTEVKKIYLDESSGNPFPQVLSELTTGIKLAITETTAYFSQKYSYAIDWSQREFQPGALTLDIGAQS